MSEKEDNKEKREVPVLSLQEYLEMKNGNGEKILGPIRIKPEDAKKALEYFENM
nr:hypothetical protein [uncultured Anaerosporobacter sp.]